MELKEFISETIVQITEGIIDAQVKCKDKDVIINPKVTIGGNGDFYIPSKESTVKMERRVQQIEMDVCVTVSDYKKTDTGAKAGISVLAANVNSTKNNSNINENRVKFTVPVSLPVSKEL